MRSSIVLTWPLAIPVLDSKSEGARPVFLITCTESLLARDRKSLKLFKLLAGGPLQAQNAYGGFRTVIRGLGYLLVCVLLLVCELRFFSLNLPGCIRNVHFQKYVFGLIH